MDAGRVGEALKGVGANFVLAFLQLYLGFAVLQEWERSLHLSAEESVPRLRGPAGREREAKGTALAERSFGLL